MKQITFENLLNDIDTMDRIGTLCYDTDGNETILLSESDFTSDLDN